MNKRLLIILFVIIVFFYMIFKSYKKKKNTYIEYKLYNGSKWGPKKTANAYRFGDIFSGYIFEQGGKTENARYIDDISINYPNTFGSKYIEYNGYPEKYKKSDYDILERIFNESNFKKPDDKTLVIHLRLGDIFDKNIPHLSNYYYDIEYYHELLKKVKKNSDIKKVEIVTGLHINVFIKESNDKLNDVRNIFESEYPVNVIITNDPDKDLYYMCHSKYFVKSGEKGRFSQIAANYVEKKNNTVYQKD